MSPMNSITLAIKPMKRTHWTPAELEILRTRYPHTRAEDLLPMLPGRTIKTIQQKAASSGWKKTREFIAEMSRQAMSRPDHPAHRTRFVKGGSSWNKGISFTAGGRSPETRFKPGNRSGRANELHKPIGFERISKDGYLERKINEDMPFQRRWRAVHLILWEAHHGPLPAGHAVVFKDGDKTHIALDNLALITRVELMRRNSAHNHGPEIYRLIQLKGAITRQINKRKDATA